MAQPSQPSREELFGQFYGPTVFTPWARVLLEYAAPQPGERVLDLACATGTVARQVARALGPTGTVVGVDINPEMLAVARGLPAPEGATIEWREGDASQLDLPDDAFDLLLCQQGLQFFPHPLAAAREMKRVIRRGGRAVLSVWQPLPKHPVYSVLLEAEARHLGVPTAQVATPFLGPDADELRGLLTEAGFERVQIDSRSMEVRFPSADRFVAVTLSAGAAVVPGFEPEDEAARNRWIEVVAAECEGVLEQYRDGDGLKFPMPNNVALAYA